MIGEVIEHYRVLEAVGRGGMGTVFKAIDINLDRLVAIKFLNTELRSDPDFVARFRHEARVQAVLNHPNVATLFDFLVWRDSPVAVMEFIEGETLADMIQRRGPIPAHIGLPIIKQALLGVAAGHRRGIIHRDLKPANLMINLEGVVKVTDFGIAKVQNAPGVTQASTRIGSSFYMAPEQILGRTVDARTDIYAMGVTLYELLSGRPPFEAKAQFEVETAHVREIPPEPTIHYPHIPQAAVQAVMRALAKDPADRFASAEEFIQALPDLQGVPYVGPTQKLSTTATPDVIPPIAPKATRPAFSTVALSPTVMPSDAPASNVAPPAASVASSVDADPPAVHGRNRATARRAAIAAGTSGLLAVVGIAYWVQRNPTVPSTASNPLPAVVAPAAEAPRASVPSAEPPPAEPPPVQPTPEPASPSDSGVPMAPSAAAPTGTAAHPQPVVSKDLSGLWTGVYTDNAGRAQLRVVDLDMHQSTAGDITGTLTYSTDSEPAAKCSLDKSNYSSDRKLLRLIVHCSNPNHSKYLNVPLDFADVDPRATALRGGRLEFHLADDISVNLKRRAKGV